MSNCELSELHKLVQSTANSVWACNPNAYNSDSIDCENDFGRDLGFALQNRAVDISLILQKIAEEEAAKQMSPQLDFSNFVRPASKLGYKSVFVGNEWIVVPFDSTVSFRQIQNGNQVGVGVSIKYQDNRSEYTYTETIRNNSLEDALSGLNVTYIDQAPEYIHRRTNEHLGTDWLESEWVGTAESIYGAAEKSVNAYGDAFGIATEAFKASSVRTSDVKRAYRKKIHTFSKKAKTYGYKIKPGEVFQSSMKAGRKALKVSKKVPAIGTALTFGNVMYESTTDKWDAHTVVDGVMLIVGIGALVVGSAPIATGVAVLGLLDLCFGIGDSLDGIIGRKSGFWDDAPLSSYPENSTLLFEDYKETKIDNTYVAPRPSNYGF